MDLRFEFSTVDLTYRRSKGEIGDRRLTRALLGGRNAPPPLYVS